jgi:hypothetical protein
MMATTVATSIPELQMEAVRERFPVSSLTGNADGSWTVEVRDVPLDLQCWNQSSTTIRFILPIGYPAAKPDCFYADPELRLRSGAMPHASNMQALPHSGIDQLWFSWHVDYWNAARDSLLTFVRVVQVRLATGQ